MTSRVSFQKGRILSKPVGSTVHEHGILAVTTPSKGGQLVLAHAWTDCTACVLHSATSTTQITVATPSQILLTTPAPQQWSSFK